MFLFFKRVFNLLSHLTCITNLIFFKNDFGKTFNKFIFVELCNEVYVSITQPPIPQPTLIKHGRKTFIMTIVFFNINCTNIFIFMFYENCFIIMINILDKAMRRFKNHFKSFITRLSNTSNHQLAKHFQSRKKYHN